MTSLAETHAVTGAISYTGRYIADELRARGIGVRALVRRPLDQGAGGIDCRTLQFDDPERLTADLEGVAVLYNTYWIRFEREGITFDGAVRNTGILTEAAKRAGLRRIVHISVSNPGLSSPFAYFRGKAAAEAAVHGAGVPASIIRPTLVFGDEDILINNIAWLLRHFHVFAMPGDGAYRVQPVFVADVAALAVKEAMAEGDRTLDAAGPEIVSFDELVRMLRDATRAAAVIARLPPSVTLAMGRLVSVALRDAVITDEELGALVAETLVSANPPTTQTTIGEWLADHGADLGRDYRSELRRHWSRR
jgi:uncharacterized protein YbjT (DUF2867 family)